MPIKMPPQTPQAPPDPQQMAAAAPTSMGPNLPPTPPGMGIQDNSAATLQKYGASVGTDGALKIKGDKEFEMSVVTMAQNMFQPNMMNLPPLKPASMPMIQGVGTTPAMNTQNAWSQGIGKK